MAERTMIAEVTIHLGTEWRDVALFLMGITAGALLGFAIMEARRQKQ